MEEPCNNNNNTNNSSNTASESSSSSLLIPKFQSSLKKFESSTYMSETWFKARHELKELGLELSALLTNPMTRIEVQADGNLLKYVKNMLIPESTKEVMTKLPIGQCVLGRMYDTQYSQGFSLIYDNRTKDAKIVSQNARSKSKDDRISNVYGEIEFFNFTDLMVSCVEILESSKKVSTVLESDSVAKYTFVDLGSGTGKAVVAASLLPCIKKAIGIELFEELHRAALKKKKIVEETCQSFQKVELLNDDVLDVDWASSAQIVFCHATCFDIELWESISKKAESMKGGSIFVSVSMILSSGLFEVLSSFSCKMEWGMCTVYIQRRLRVGKWASSLLSGKQKALDHQRSGLKEDEVRQVAP